VTRKGRQRAPGYLTASEVAAYLALGESTLERLIRQGLFPPPTRHAGVGDRVWPRRVVSAYRVLAPLLPELFALRRQRRGKSGKSDPPA
jgi:predicted DNA-binding transcriptional regulator AlpA